MKGITKIWVLTLAGFLLTGCPPSKEKSKEAGDKVALEFHIMSKCPYGVKVVQSIAPVMEKMGDRVDLKIHYIGKEQNGELTSMHGPKEVSGDIIQLCADELGDNAQWMSFLKCQADDWRNIPDGWEACAAKAKLDTSAMKKCFEGEEGKKLLKTSFAESNKKKATGSPTIFLAGERYTGGRSEDSFAAAICAKMAEPKAKHCKDLPAPTKVTIVSDKRCKERGCNTRGFISFIGNNLGAADVKELDYSEPEGKELFEKSGQQFLPIAVFGPELEKDEAAYSKLKRRIAKMEGTNNMVFPLGRTWDPKAEVCDDGVDNTSDGKVDCDDESCKGKKACREEIKNKVDIFVMSQCPYGVRAVDAMEDVLKNFVYDRNKLDFELNYIGDENNGEFRSLHGPNEVEENKRQICAQKHYPKKYKFMDYILCRNKDYRNTEWESCAKGGIQAAVIKKCAEGEEGKELLAKSFEKSNELGITGSPSWLLNNKFDMRGQNPNTIKNAFCEKNAAVAGCENQLSTGDTAKSVPAGSCGGGAATAPTPKPTQVPAPKPSE